MSLSKEILAKIFRDVMNQPHLQRNKERYTPDFPGDWVLSRLEDFATDVMAEIEKVTRANPVYQHIFQLQNICVRCGTHGSINNPDTFGCPGPIPVSVR